MLRSFLLDRALILFLILAAAHVASEARAQTPISQPTEINAPGSYVLTTDLEVPNCERVIVINADLATLDLRGHSIECPNGASDSRIVSIENRAGIRIRGGVLSGADYGIYYHSGEAAMALDVRGVRLRNFSDWGIYAGGSRVQRVLDVAVVEDNHLSGPGGGIFVRRGAGRVAGNVLETGGVGLYLLDNRGVLVTENRIRSESTALLASQVETSVLRGNTLRSLGGQGLDMTGARSNLISRNLVTSSERGLRLDATSHGNAIDWNHFGETPVGVEIAAGALENLLSNNRNLVNGPTTGVLGGPGFWHDAGGNVAD